MSTHQHLEGDEPKSFLSIIKVNPFDNLTEKILLKCEASKTERKRNETREELQKIQERISYSIDQYEYSSKKALELLEESVSNGEAHVEVVDDPVQLYEILSDARQKAQYKQRFTVFIVGYEEKCDDRENLLRQVEDFFMETKAGNLTKLANELSSDEFNFEDSLDTMSSALETTSIALAKLQKLQQDISQVFSVYAEFPNDKKGRKKLEKALLKAQEHCSVLNSSLVSVQEELGQTKDKSKKLQKQLDLKNSEVGKLHKSLEEAKLLKGSNESLQKELKDTNELLLMVRQENDKLKKSQISTTSVLVSPEYLKLKAELETQRELNEQLHSEQQVKEGSLLSEIETIKENYEAEIKELRDKFEEQMKSLMDLDDVDYEDHHSSNEALMDDNMEHPADGVMIDEDVILSSDSTAKENVSFTQAMDDIALPQEANPNAEDVQFDNPPVVEQQAPSAPPVVPVDFVSRQEAEAKQKQLEEELKGANSKSKKTITSLKAQLADHQSKHEAAMNNYKKEIDKLVVQFGALKQERDQERSHFETVNSEKERIEHELSQLLLARDEQTNTINDLHAQLEDVLQQQAALAEAADVDLVAVSRSVQWETPVCTRSNTPVPSHGNTPLPGHRSSRGSASRITSHGATSVCSQDSTSELHSYSEADPELVPMHEVTLEDGKSSGKTSRSHRQSVSPQVVLSRLEENQENLGSSILSSEISSISLSSNVPPTLITRRQSHTSELPSRFHPPPVTMDHPIVKEWQKAYKSVLDFKNKIADLLNVVGSPHSAAELSSIYEVRGGDHTAIAQSQVTLMRQNLTATVNKIEQVLNEEMRQLAQLPKSQVVIRTEDSEGQLSEDELLKVKVELKNAKRTINTECEEHRKMLSDLEAVNNQLRAEVAYLKQSATENQNETSELVMFTRLDSNRNSLSLKSALQSNKISDDVYSQTVKSMEDYGNISSRQFANLAQQYKHCMVINQIMHQLEGLSPTRKEAVQENVVQYSQRKSRQLSTELDDLRMQRSQLADALTTTLSEIENDSGVFLIKPIIRGINNRNVFEPSFRSPTKLPPRVKYSTSARGSVVVAKSKHDGGDKNHSVHHPKLQQISAVALRAPDASTRHAGLQLIDLLHRQRRMVTWTKPESVAIFGSEPPSSRPKPVKTEKKWNVNESVVNRPSSGNKGNGAKTSSQLPPINIPLYM